jgi:hypothetical protein
MPDTLVEGLSGTEIINDILDQVKRKLNYSCNLRDSDSYGQGYSAEITIKLKMYGMDVTPDEFAVTIPAKSLPPVTTGETIVTPFDVEEKIEIPQELDLEAVRERIKEPDAAPPVSEAEEARMPVRLKRKYSRRVGVGSLEQPSMGGAVDIDAEDAEVKF